MYCIYKKYESGSLSINMQTNIEKRQKVKTKIKFYKMINV